VMKLFFGQVSHFLNFPTRVSAGGGEEAPISELWR
jgi:hypothetical protein